MSEKMRKHPLTNQTASLDRDSDVSSGHLQFRERDGFDEFAIFGTGMQVTFRGRLVSCDWPEKF